MSAPPVAAQSGQAGRAALAARMLAVDPAGLGGVRLRGRPGLARDRWLALLRAALPDSAPWRRLPAGTAPGRLLGGLDLAATLQTGRPIAERGLLAECDGGIVVVPMAERMSTETAAHLAAALDRGEVVLERDGFGQRLTARFGIVALDEGGVEPGPVEDEALPAKLVDRLAFSIDLEEMEPLAELTRDGDPAAAVRSARARLPNVVADDSIIDALSEAAVALGICSLRPVLHAIRAARIAAALAGRDAVTRADATMAAGLVLGPRAERVPAEAQPPESDREPADPPASGRDAEPPDPPPQGGAQEPNAQEGASAEVGADLVLAAARAAIPSGLLARLRAGAVVRREQSGAGRAGQPKASTRRGRPAGVRAGLPAPGVRLDIVETLRAAAPWQRLRAAALQHRDGARLLIRSGDFRIVRYKRRAETTTVFVVDASGSSALNRLAEAKGAVELLLSECYVRRDHVALMAFRGRGADLVLPPTRSLARAKRCLAGLPGGGGTPLAAALVAARGLADAVRRKGQTPAVVLMTDGRANVALDGAAGRASAEADAVAAARQLGGAGHGVLFVDTSSRPHPFARVLADAMAAHYLVLPRADAAALSRAVRETAEAAGG